MIQQLIQADGDIETLILFAQAIQPDLLKIRAHDVARPLVLLDGAAAQIIQCLLVGGIQIHIQRLCLTNQLVGHKEINTAVPAGAAALSSLLKNIEVGGINTEARKEICPILLRIFLLRAGLIILAPGGDSFAPAHHKL